MMDLGHKAEELLELTSRVLESGAVTDEDTVALRSLLSYLKLGGLKVGKWIKANPTFSEQIASHLQPLNHDNDDTLNQVEPDLVQIAFRLQRLATNEGSATDN